MGSIEKACISGFLCRLCSEMHRTVIHIYGDHGQRLCLVEKINGYLPITISPTDPLPKTICKTCLERVEQHYTLLMRLTRMREERKLKLLALAERDEDNCSISSVECSDDEESESNKTDASNRASSSNKATTAQNRNRTSEIDDENVASSSTRQTDSPATSSTNRNNNSSTELGTQELMPTT